MQTFEIKGLSPVGFHKLFGRIYGDPNNKNVIIAAHGLTRNSSDFHFIGEALSKDYCVYAMDLIGRGQSQWPEDPSLYNFPQYLSDLNNLISFTGARQVTWLGTSLGGLLGMLLASQPQSPICRLIINDVGPTIPQEAFDRIKAYAGIKISFANRDEASTVLKEIFKPFHITDPNKWSYFMENTLHPETDGTLSMAYDPKIIGSMASDALFNLASINLYPYWDRLDCPILVLHGAVSDILTPSILKEMQSHKTPFDYFKIPDVGHAPTLFDGDQIALVEKWLRETAF